MQPIENYAALLTEYCLALKAGDKLLVRSTYLAEPLLQAVYRRALRLGVDIEFELQFREMDRILLDNGESQQLQKPSLLYQYAVENFDAILTIDAPFNLCASQRANNNNRKLRQAALAPIKRKFMKRSAKKLLRWALCVYPTEAAAQAAGMSLTDYQNFVFNACFLQEKKTVSAWRSLSKRQAKIVASLNKIRDITITAPGTKLSLSVAGRIWINSDGRRNMPSGEVFTSPVEDSINGKIYFSYPSEYLGKTVRGVRLTVKNGTVVHWEAEQGKDLLDTVFAIPGANRFGEFAIGTNPHIQEGTLNTLFDEKIAGTLHMALGASYPETGGKNDSAVHWDLVTDMRNGRIEADGKCIYQNGKFKFTA